MAINSSALALDVGERRIGVARSSLAARLPEPLLTLENDETLYERLRSLIDQEQAIVLVVGWPRGLQGQKTPQTAVIESFVNQLKPKISIPVVLQDEAGTSKKAEDELKRRGKGYTKGAVDALAAVYILEDYLAGHPEVK